METSLLDERLAAAVAERIASLPLLPSVVSQLLSLDVEQGSYIDDVHRLAAWDPTLAVRLVEYASRTIRISGAAEKFQLRMRLLASAPDRSPTWSPPWHCWTLSLRRRKAIGIYGPIPSRWASSPAG
jgi:hypothetical protein